jgi:hypothetical protein
LYISAFSVLLDPLLNYKQLRGAAGVFSVFFLDIVQKYILQQVQYEKVLMQLKQIQVP